MDDRGRRRGGAVDEHQTLDAEADTLERLLAVSDGKPFENLSWRLLRLLIKGVRVERRELGKGDTLKISDDMDVIHVEQGSLEKQGELASDLDSRILAMGDFGKTEASPDKLRYRNTRLLSHKGTYEATTRRAIVRIFFKPKMGLAERGSRKPPAKGRYPRKGPKESRWDWLCERSLVARTALMEADLAKEKGGEVVLLTSKDLVEYLPALTDLLAQAMLDGTDHEEPPLRVCLLRFDPKDAEKRAPSAPFLEQLEVMRFDSKEAEARAAKPLVALDITGAGAPPALDEEPSRAVDIVVVSAAAELVEKISSKRQHYDYVFVDPYDRASDLAAVQVKLLAGRGRVSDTGQTRKQHRVGSTLSQNDFESMLEGVHSLVHVARNFRVVEEDPDKLNFYAVVLDSRTARFESGGSRDRQQRRNADDPVPSKVDPPEGRDDATPTTRLHLNLLRLKKAWEQSPLFDDVCDVLDEPNVPTAGDRRGYWSAKSFFERWVRDLRFRRVGVALGGGGATGFSHVALLRALREETIPIDLVSGTSFGALVGAYYCSHGLDGLDMLVEQSLLYTGVASLTIFTSAFFEHLVNLSIDYRPMWELPIPLYAVATDIETGREAVFPGPAAANPSVGFAVRASGSLPGFFAPALAGDVRYVDGGAVSMVPVKALIRFGADVVIGSNSFPFRRLAGDYRPPPLRGFLPPPFGRLAERVLAEFNPGNRMTDTARSMSLSLTDAMEKEKQLASAMYEHKRTDVKYWEFHRAGLVLRGAVEDLATSGALPGAIHAFRLLNTPF